jgi:hypothetical protein
MTPEEQKERKREINARYREKHREEIRIRRKEYDMRYLENHRGKREETNRKYREKNREQINERNRERYKENPQVFKDRTDRYYAKCKLAKIRNKFVALVDTYAIRKGYSGDKTVWEMLGCDFDTFIVYIEKQFLEGMTIDNHGRGKGKWNFDHIEPIHNSQSDKDFERLNHYTNFRPMWASDNIRKGKKTP